MSIPRPLISLAISSTFLVSCSGMGALRGTKPNYVMTANGPENVGYAHPIPESLIQQFSNDYNVAKCKTQTVQQKEAFDCGKITLPVTQDKASLNMIKSGFRLSDSVCAAYFRRIGNQDQDLDHYSNSVNIIGGLASAVMGATGAPAKSIAITATTFSGILAGFESFDSVYHFSPDVQAVENMVTKASNAYEAQLYTDLEGVDIDFYDATQAVEGYQKICQTSNIRALVNQAIEKSDLRAPDISVTADDGVVGIYGDLDAFVGVNNPIVQ